MKRNRIRTSIEIEKEDWDKFKKVCKYNGRTRGETLRRLIKGQIVGFKEDKRIT